jgi:hypothetical protein
MRNGEGIVRAFGTERQIPSEMTERTATATTEAESPRNDNKKGMTLKSKQLLRLS